MALFSSSGLGAPQSSISTTPSSDIQPYAQNVLSKGNALLDAGTPAYTGQLTAGTSGLQNQAWQGLAGLTLPTDMTAAAGNLQDIQGQAQNVSFDPSQIQQYMNPYLQASLNPQIEEARRQAQISAQPAMAKLTQAGGYGGGRQAILEAENERNLNTNLANITGQGYKNAYDEAMKAAQYSTDLGLKGLATATTANQAAGNIGAQEAQYGLQNLQALSTAGGIQQGQEQAGLNAQYNEWLRQQNYLPTALKNQQALISGMPGGTTQTTYGAAPSALQSVVGSTAGVASLMKNLKDAGYSGASLDNIIKSIGINPSTLQEDKSTWTPGDNGTFTTVTGQTIDAQGNPVEVNADGTYTNWEGITFDKTGQPIE